MLEKLSNCKPHGSTFLKGAPLCIVVYADPEKCDVWLEDCSIASIIIQLTAESMGLGSCWIQIRNRQYSEKISAEVYIKELLGIPVNYKVEAIIAIGYADEQKQPHPKESLDFTKVRY
jgi:nitroreductase